MSQIIKQILAVLIGLGMIILIIVLIVRGFSSTSSSGEQTKPVELATYANTTSRAVLNIDGPIVAEVDHRSMRISVGSTDVVVDVFQGYEGTVIQHQTFANNANSYSTFLQALQGQGFTEGNNDKELADERGACPSGNRFVYSLTDGAQTVFRYWSTSCGTGQGTFKGKASSVQNLFKAQIPNAARPALVQAAQTTY